MLGPFLCDLVSQAPLLPKLRGHFAEFLNNASSVGLRILSSSTCVGLWYGHVLLHSGFSWRCGFTDFATWISLRIRLQINSRDFPQEHSFVLAPVFPFPAPVILPRPHISKTRGTGISTCCPSATPPGLALGPDLPRADQLYPGILGYSAARILTLLSLLIPAFSLQNAPPLLIGTASSCSQCSSTTHTFV